MKGKWHLIHVDLNELRAGQGFAAVHHVETYLGKVAAFQKWCGRPGGRPLRKRKRAGLR